MGIYDFQHYDRPQFLPPIVMPLVAITSAPPSKPQCLSSQRPIPVEQIDPVLHGPPLGPRWPLARLTVARPLANPTPRPRVPRERNIGAFLKSKKCQLS